MLESFTALDATGIDPNHNLHPVCREGWHEDFTPLETKLPTCEGRQA